MSSILSYGGDGITAPIPFQRGALAAYKAIAGSTVYPQSGSLPPKAWAMRVSSTQFLGRHDHCQTPAAKGQFQDTQSDEIRWAWVCISPAMFLRGQHSSWTMAEKS